VQYVLTGGTSMEIKTEADSFSMTECSHDAEPSTGIFVILMMYSLQQL